MAAGYLSDTQLHELQQLLEALDRDCPEELVHYRDLFLQDSDLSQVRPTPTFIIPSAGMFHAFHATCVMDL